MPMRSAVVVAILAACWAVTPGCGTAQPGVLPAGLYDVDVTTVENGCELYAARTTSVYEVSSLGGNRYQIVSRNTAVPRPVTWRGAFRGQVFAATMETRLTDPVPVRSTGHLELRSEDDAISGWSKVEVQVLELEPCRDRLNIAGRYRPGSVTLVSGD